MRMLKRRDFLKTSSGTAAALLAGRRFAWGLSEETDAGLHFVSASMEVALSQTAPEFVSLNVDGLGKSRRGANIVDASGAGSGFTARAKTSNGVQRVEYIPANASADTSAAWTFEFSGSRIKVTSQWTDGAASVPIVIRFQLTSVYSTVLGVFREENVLVTPVLMHFPGQGSIRLTASIPDIELGYTSNRSEHSAVLSLPAASAEHKSITYLFDVTAVYPNVPGIEGDARFDAFRRDWLNILQLNPSDGALANNTASTTCAFCYYEYADIAALSPPLAEGLTALDLVRQTLDRILAGGMAYGLGDPGSFPGAASDTYPSMLIAAANCVRDGTSDAWLEENYGGIRAWAEVMLATDTNGDGLIKYAVSGDSGIWSGSPKVHPSNWWDTIGFGHEDAYANALAYRALGNMAMLAKRVGKAEDAARYTAAAGKLCAVYYKTFYDPETGVLGGWRSTDGQLHDYYFLWVNGIAIHYGLVERPEADAIMDKLMAKMKEVGYDKFNMGLPGNLITVPLKDYVARTLRVGGGVLPDNSDGFENYENGGATGDFAFFTLAALYDLGRKAEADKILFAMLSGYNQDGFQGRGANGRSFDWRRWDGTATGYEGYLTDNYYALLAVPLRQAESTWKSGYRQATNSF
jgi:hypothetical protein